MTNTVVEIEYLYFDELKERYTGWRSGLMVVYDTCTKLGRDLQDAMESESVESIDKVLEHFDVTDDEVVFYIDRAGIEEGSIMLEAQAANDMVINSYTTL